MTMALAASLAVTAVAGTVLRAPPTRTPVPPSGSHTIGPPYSVQPALTPQGRPRGVTFVVPMTTAHSRGFNGTDPTFRGAACGGPTPGECCHKVDECAVRAVRNVTVYVPPQLADRAGMPPSRVLVMQDGPELLEQVSYALDNLAGAIKADGAPLAGGSMPPFVAVSVQNGGSDAIKSERGLEYDTMSGRYAEFVNSEVLPAVLASPQMRQQFPHLTFSKHPFDRGVMGCSSGGAAAFSAAWFSGTFGRVIAYSATLVDQQDHDDRTGARAANPFGAWEYHSHKRLIATTPRKPIRIFHQNAEFDLGYNCTSAPVDEKPATVDTNNTAGDPLNWTDGHHNWRTAGNRTAQALAGAGYNYRHIFSLDTHHCDQKAILATLAGTLVWVWAAPPRS